MISQENDFQVLKSTFSVGWHAENYENVVYQAWEQKIREINFFYGERKYKKRVFICKFFVNFKESNENVAFVTGKWNFDQLEIKDN